jgi:hypothetical protein
MGFDVLTLTGKQGILRLSWEKSEIAVPEVFNR